MEQGTPDNSTSLVMSAIKVPEDISCNADSKLETGHLGSSLEPGCQGVVPVNCQVVSPCQAPLELYGSHEILYTRSSRHRWCRYIPDLILECRPEKFRSDAQNMPL
jgi:hypothetical protein